MIIRVYISRKVGRKLGCTCVICNEPSEAFSRPNSAGSSDESNK